MSDETQAESYGSDEAPTPLATFGDVRRALAKCLRRLEKGTLDPSVAGIMVNGYGTLAKMHREEGSAELERRLDAVEKRQAAH